jgi:glutaconyl-CoA/methylmalonyl-CoA decarboxylase subunit delta
VSEWLEVGARLTVNGLSLVFLVLALLWGLIVLLLRFDRPVAADAAMPAEPPGHETLGPPLVAAVAIAVRAHIDAGRWHPSRRRGAGPSRWTTAGREHQTHHWPRDRG